MDNKIIRLVEEKDVPAILDIYAPFIRDTHHSFEVQVPSLESFRQRVSSIMKTHPWLVFESTGQIAGYAYASFHRRRAAYQWTTESSVYVHPNFRRQGIAQLLYQTLIKILAIQGFVNVYAIIALPNDASLKFHQQMGFQHIGLCKQVGYKGNEWTDTSWWQYIIQDQPSNPMPPTWLPNLDAKLPDWKKALHDFHLHHKKE